MNGFDQFGIIFGVLLAIGVALAIVSEHYSKFCPKCGKKMEITYKNFGDICTRTDFRCWNCGYTRREVTCLD